MEDIAEKDFGMKDAIVLERLEYSSEGLNLTNTATVSWVPIQCFRGMHHADIPSCHQNI